MEKNCVSYSKLSVPFRYDGRFSWNVKSSPQWFAWLSGISQRLEWTIRILRFLSVFIKQGNHNCFGRFRYLYLCFSFHLLMLNTVMYWVYCFLQIGDWWYITAKIAFILEDRFHSRLFTCMIFIYSQSFFSSLHGFIWNKHNEHFPVSLVAQLIERWSGLNFLFFYFSIFFIFLRPYF